MFIATRSFAQVRGNTSASLGNSSTRGLLLLASSATHAGTVNAVKNNYALSRTAVATATEYRNSNFGQLQGAGDILNAGLTLSLPTTRLNAAFSATGQASFLILGRVPSGLTDAAGNKSLFCIRGSGGSNDHYPFTDGRIYMQPFSSTRWIVAVPSVPLDSIHCFIATHKSGEQRAYQNGINVAGASVVETPSLDAATVGLGGNGIVYLAAFWSRVLSDAEIKKLSINPWELFAPNPRKIWSAVSGGASIYTLSVSGGVVFSGAIPLRRERRLVPSGGVNFSGTSLLRRERRFVVSGGVNFSGSAAIIFNAPNIYNIIPSGGVTLSGAAALRRTRLFTPSGGVAFSGAAPLIRTRLLAPTGQVTFQGSAGIVFIPAGGLPYIPTTRITVGSARSTRIS